MKDWTKIYKKYSGLWVALDKDETTVVGSGKTIDKAITVANENGVNKPIVILIPRNNTLIAGCYGICI